MAGVRLTKAVVERLLCQNEGFKHVTSYAGKNFSETRVYELVEGALRIHSTGKTSWAASAFDTTVVADAEQTRRFLRSVLGLLNSQGV